MNTGHKYTKHIPEVPETALDIYRMLPEGTRCEVIFNELIMSPSPSSQHQFLLSDLHGLLYDFLKGKNIAKAVLSPFDVYFENYVSAVQPDLIVLLNETLNKVEKDGLYGAPDIAIEILSQNKSHHTKRKRALYEKAGVKEYFMIDPENKNVTLLTLNASGFYEQTYEETGVLKSGVIDCNITF
ncbi:MAG: Uma2 family endonuclease [Mucilaginibacter sp.]